MVIATNWYYATTSSTQGIFPDMNGQGARWHQLTSIIHIYSVPASAQRCCQWWGLGWMPSSAALWLQLLLLVTRMRAYFCARVILACGTHNRMTCEDRGYAILFFYLHLHLHSSLFPRLQLTKRSWQLDLSLRFARSILTWKTLTLSIHRYGISNLPGNKVYSTLATFL